MTAPSLRKLEYDLEVNKQHYIIGKKVDPSFMNL